MHHLFLAPALQQNFFDLLETFLRGVGVNLRRWAVVVDDFPSYYAKVPLLGRGASVRSYPRIMSSQSLPGFFQLPTTMDRFAFSRNPNCS